MNKPLYNLQNTDRNKIVKSEVSKCYKSGDFWLSVGQKLILIKWALKIWIVTEINRRIDKVK